MIFSEKLQLLRKSKGLTQENLAEKMDVSRQAVARWEAGQAYPDIGNLIAISRLFHVTVDYLVKDQACAVSCTNGASRDIEKLVAFRLEANVHTYAAYMNAVDSTRLDSHDFSYQNGAYTYHDTYVGGEQFAGEEAIWYQGKSQYAMNYMGRVLGQQFSGVRSFAASTAWQVPQGLTRPSGMVKPAGSSSSCWKAYFTFMP